LTVDLSRFLGKDLFLMPPSSQSPRASLAPPAVAGKPVGRCESLDTVRGLLLVVMALNHIPSVLAPLTQQPLGFATAAEGFVFIAGLVVGLVYGGRWERQGPYATTRSLLARAGVIYQAHLACVFGIFAWMVLYASDHATAQLPVASPWIWFQKPWSSWLATLLLVNQPGLLDVLPTYCGLIAITPLVLGELAKGRKWRLLAITILWWAATNYFDPPRPTVIGVINTGAFNFGAWQLLYVIGVMAGHAWLRGTLPDWRPGRVTVAALVLAVVFFSACSHHWLTLGLSHDTWFALTNKNNLAPVRLLNVGVLVLLGHLCLRGRRDDLGLPDLSDGQPVEPGHLGDGASPDERDLPREHEHLARAAPRLGNVDAGPLRHPVLVGNRRDAPAPHLDRELGQHSERQAAVPDGDEPVLLSDPARRPHRRRAERGYGRRPPHPLRRHRRRP